MCRSKYELLCSNRRVSRCKLLASRWRSRQDISTYPNQGLFQYRTARGCVSRSITLRHLCLFPNRIQANVSDRQIRHGYHRHRVTNVYARRTSSLRLKDVYPRCLCMLRSSSRWEGIRSFCIRCRYARPNSARGTSLCCLAERAHRNHSLCNCRHQLTTSVTLFHGRTSSRRPVKDRRECRSMPASLQEDREGRLFPRSQLPWPVYVTSSWGEGDHGPLYIRRISQRVNSLF